MDRTLHVVIMSLWPAEVGHDSVAQILRDMPAKALNCTGRPTMIIRDDFAPLFGIELRGEAGRVHQVAKQHRQMSPLAGDRCRNPSISCGCRGNITQGCAARVAESGGLSIVRAAFRTAHRFLT